MVRLHRYAFVGGGLKKIESAGRYVMLWMVHDVRMTYGLGGIMGSNPNMGIPVGAQLGPNWGWGPIGAQFPIGGLSLPLVVKARPF